MRDDSSSGVVTERTGAEDRITRSFRSLRRLLAREARFALQEDLEGMGGVLFRTYWLLREEEGGPRRWSARSAGVCSGDPLGRAAEAYGVRLVQCRAEGGPAGVAAIERRLDISPVLIEGDGGWALAGPGDLPPARPDPFRWAYLEEKRGTTLGDRIAFHERSLRVGIALAEEKELREEGVFAAGLPAYDAILADLSGDPPPIAGPGAGKRGTAALEAALRAFGHARLRLALYLDRTANFVDTGKAPSHFHDEGAALLDALAAIRSAPERSGVEGPGAPRFRIVRRRVRTAKRSYARGIDSLRKIHGGPP